MIYEGLVCHGHDNVCYHSEYAETGLVCRCLFGWIKVNLIEWYGTCRVTFSTEDV